MKRLLTLLAMGAVLAAVLRAQVPLTGRWQERTASGLDIQLDLIATNETVTGTFTVRGRPLTITGGQVSNGTFTFKAKLDDQPEGFTGKLTGDEITLWRDRNGRSDAVVLRRAPVSLSGRWRGQTPNGFDLVLDLTTTEKALTGTLTREGQPATISEGKVSGNTFTFTATLNDQTERFTGEFAGDEMKVWLDRQGRERAAALTRAKQ